MQCPQVNGPRRRSPDTRHGRGRSPLRLDFGGAYLDQAPDFSDDVLVEQKELEERFGARCAEVRAIMRELQVYGIFLLDANPGNISFGD